MNVVHYVCAHTSRCTCVCARTCVLDWEESKVFASRALVDEHVSDQLQWLPGQFLWITFAT